MKQEIIKFQHEEYHTIIHKSSNPIDYKEPRTIPTDIWLDEDDLFGSIRRTFSGEKRRVDPYEPTTRSYPRYDQRSSSGGSLGGGVSRSRRYSSSDNWDDDDDDWL